MSFLSRGVYFFIVGIFCLGRAVAQQTEVPLPSDVLIEKPGGDVPEALAQFVGVWGRGAWGGLLPHILIVERMNARGEARVIYAIGDNPLQNIKRLFYRTDGKVEDGVLSFSRGGSRLEYRLVGNLLSGTFRRGSSEARVELLRTSLEELATVEVAPALQEVWIPVGSVKLQANLSRPKGDGPFPLIVFNHGSTGPGVVPVSQTIWHGTIGRFFAAQGYAVLMPMRRGRGRSEGSYGEGEVCDWSVGQNGMKRAMEDLDAVFVYAKALPFVDHSRIVLGGQSRGGILSVIFAANRPGAVAAVMNFAGGWYSDACVPFFNEFTFKEAGAGGKASNLWLYAENDSYYSAASIRKYAAVFQGAGGDLTFRLYGSDSSNGHNIVNTSRWTDDARAFLERLNLSSSPGK